MSLFFHQYKWEYWRWGKEFKRCLHHTPLLPKETALLEAKLSLLHPCDTGNYIVRDESEKVPMKLKEDSDECDDHTDDHRNVWIIP